MNNDAKPWGFGNQVPKETSPHLLFGARDQRLSAGQDQLPCGSTGNPCDKCQEKETRMVRSCQLLRQPLQNYPTRHLGVLATPWSAGKMLDRQRQRMDIPVHARTADNAWAPAEKTGRGSLLSRLSCPPDDPSSQETELNWADMNCAFTPTRVLRLTRCKCQVTK